MSDDDKGRVEWVSRVDMAQLAEALGIDSDLVISATMREYGLLVMWTTSDDYSEQIMGSVLLPDDDGILRVVKTGPTGSTLQDWADKVAAKMKERGIGAHEDAHEPGEPAA